MRSSPFCRFSRRARVRSEAMERAGVSSMNNGISARCRLAQDDGIRERRLEGLEPALDLAALGEIEEPLLGGLDLAFGRMVEIVPEGVVDDVLAERDELAA